MITFMAVSVRGGDSPRFRGPNGDGKFNETGLLKEWPGGGPRLAWSVDRLGKGYSSAVAGSGIVYITGMDGAQQGRLFAFNPDGSLKWKTAYGPEVPKRGPAPAGTRGTPTINGDKIFLMTGLMKLHTFDLATGKLLRSVDLMERFSPEKAKFGFTECVLVDGRKVICTPGGPDASLVALDRNTGQTIWKTEGLSEPSGYCSARLINHKGKRLLITMVAQGVVAVDPDSGKVLWQYEHPHRAGVQPNPPLYEDGMVYICSGMGVGGEMLAIADDGLSVTPKWADKTLDCQMHGFVVVDGYIYGAAQSANNGMVCLEFKTGKVMWSTKDIKKGAVIFADGMLYVYSEDGVVHLIKANPKAFEHVSKFPISMGTNEHWAHPTIANGRLYIRHGDALMAYDIKAEP
jgi:outer membrane protein assembly factor BamB